MNWVTNFLTSSIGRKLIMSLTGLFLILFLIIHLVGNLQLLINDGGKTFNEYAYMMTNNPLIKVVSWGNYFFILLHAFQGILLWRKNAAAKGQKYAVSTSENASWASKNMGPLGLVILAFILLHMWQFWFQMHYVGLPMANYDGLEVSNLYGPVSEAFSQLPFVIFYVACMGFIALHLSHGFQSAFQSMGLNHKKYTPAIKFLGTAYSILVPLGFAIIPVFFFLFR